MRSVLFATLLFGAACSVPAQADQMPPSQAVIAAPHIAIANAPAKVRAPYDVQIIKESGETQPTYAKGDRYYVQGNAGERYIIRIVNPTGNRVEAVVSVDGLDVVDGEAGDLKKRGYVVPPYGETRIEGFRTSTEDVATFRFSSVDGSYAGKKGAARNVGVVAVALFEELHTEPQQIIVTETKPGFRAPYDYGDDVDARRMESKKDSVTADRGGGGRVRTFGESAAPPAEAPAGRIAPTTPSRPMPAPPPPRAKKALDEDYDANYAPDAEEGGDYYGGVTQNAPRKTERPGLGTEFGEQRYSAASYTKFVRNNERPIAIAELRYNDAAGLMALGIPVQPMPDEGEIMTRETADPFPGDSRFSRRP